ncbi:MarR family winged helix-turn-helix transcriptional regulator [Rathayibacter tanaceti]|uniref:DNA-binding transcriptional repressor MarR n=2 Tax=Rathayibacter tanaceti TaxID=1671680 RepID=A0A166HDH2_9MICO|nr:MarR family transcriptional regulator [Rathayibacter tanaceti]KZX20404.1 DNA-binding transcriptional repressor MarR [Rathayibacter tanaceti]QHC54408.1 MarR family transcriptional regulator [Rathayibacter tanaceti]TCO35116.1 DNA-binding MarR family transcriptional regulator [Rathayibacter tanaceti]
MDARPDLFALLKRLRTAERDYDGRVERRLGIGTTDLAALRIIGIGERNDEIVRAVDLAAALSITTAAVSLLVDRLGRAGYVDRTPDPSDGRGRILCLTARAQKAILGTDHPTYDRIRAMVARVPEAEAATVATLLDGLSRILEGQPRPEPVD